MKGKGLRAKGEVAAVTVLLANVFAKRLLACAVCLGASDSLQFKGMQAGILVLLAFTGCMLAAFAAFFLYLRRRIAASEQAAQGGSC